MNFGLLQSLVMKLVNLDLILDLLLKGLDKLVLKTDNDLDDQAVAKLKELKPEIKKQLEELLK